MSLEQLQQFLISKGMFDAGSAPTIGQMGSLDSNTIMNQYLSNYNLEGLADTISPSLFQSIPIDLLLQQQTQAYAPKKTSLEHSYLANLRKTANIGGKKAHGGFSGSGQGTRFSQGIKDEFGKSMAGVLEETTYKPMAQASQALSDWTSQWDDAMLNLSGTGT